VDHVLSRALHCSQEMLPFARAEHRPARFVDVLLRSLAHAKGDVQEQAVIKNAMRLELVRDPRLRSGSVRRSPRGGRHWGERTMEAEEKTESNVSTVPRRGEVLDCTRGTGAERKAKG
jgi:hypothetical protein